MVNTRKEICPNFFFLDKIRVPIFSISVGKAKENLEKFYQTSLIRAMVVYQV